MSRCATCQREIATPKRPSARGLCATCRKREWEKKTSIRYADLAAMSDTEIFALCRRLREQHKAACALETIRQAITAPPTQDSNTPTLQHSSQPKEPKPCSPLPRESFHPLYSSVTST